MKKLLPLFLLTLSATFAFGQSGGPDGFGYTWRDSNHPQGPAYNWIDITTFPGAQQVTDLTDDNTSTSFYQMGFNFPYYWYTVSQYKVGANGYIIFTNGNISSPFPVIPSSAQPQNYIAAMMSDLNFLGTGNNAECWVWSNNTDTLIVSYINLPFWFNNATTPYTGLNTFQMILSAADSSITFQYMLQQGSSAATTNYVTIGIENNTGAIGLQHSHDAYPPANYAIKFYYPDSSLLSITDAAAMYNDNPESGALFMTQNGDPYYMHAQIKNTGNQRLNPFNVNLRILNDIGATVVQENIMTDTLEAGDTLNLTSTLPFNPTTAGVYTFRTQTQLAGDATLSNNEKLMEIRVVDTSQVDIPLYYTGDVAVPAGTGISWSGGNSGVGIEIIPPFYPCYIRKLQYYIAYNTDATGFYSLLYDNNGLDHGPGNLLDSAYLPGSLVLYPDFWNTITLPTPIRIDSGSVFIEWRMEAANIGIGTDNNPPVCNRSYETLGGWSIFRYREDRDPMIRALVATTATAGIDQKLPDNFVGEFYPSPASERVYLDLSMTNTDKKLTLQVYNMEGQLVNASSQGTNSFERISLDVSSFSPGVYVCRIINSNQSFNRKFIVK